MFYIQKMAVFVIGSSVSVVILPTIGIPVETALMGFAITNTCAAIFFAGQYSMSKGND